MSELRLNKRSLSSLSEDDNPEDLRLKVADVEGYLLDDSSPNKSPAFRSSSVSSTDSSSSTSSSMSDAALNKN